MDITFACSAMAFGPNTPSLASLGGSETAALMLAKAVAARNHNVTMFCNLPPEGRPDYIPSGTLHADGVRYVDLKHYQNFVTANQCDVLIVLRDPGLICIPAQAKKKILWAHDIATKRGMQRALDQVAFSFDEIWAVSEWHKEQIAETTGYPRSHIFAIRNGIVAHDILSTPRSEKQLVYASRPERGLENLVKPGGVMEHLPDYKLVVAMYEHYPEHMKEYYAYITACMKRLPNVEFLGGKPNSELRQIIHDSAAYIYPTTFEETSCILARECIEQCTPFITTSVGALPETLGDCGIFFEDYLHYMGIQEPERGSKGWCLLFAEFFRDVMARPGPMKDLRGRMAERTDLYWDGVAEMVEPRFAPHQGTHFSRLWSLLQDGDVMAARAYYASVETDTSLMGSIAEELRLYDPIINGDLAAFYDGVYTEKMDTEYNELHFRLDPVGQRHTAIYEQLRDLPPGSTVMEYGCGPGHVLAPAARLFPHLTFVGYDIAEVATNVINEGAKKFDVPNLSASADIGDSMFDQKFDAVICSEVLEHVPDPWNLLGNVESFCKEGGLMIITVPFGAWEPQTYEFRGHWGERNHLWAIDRTMFKEMAGEKPNLKTMLIISAAATEWMRPVGNFLFTYSADHAPTHEVDALAKAQRHWARETCAACVIAYNNEDTIIQLLNSIEKKVQFVQIAHGPSTDQTLALINTWFEDRPWMRYNVIDVPKIEPYKFGFDDARNKSTENVAQECEWMLWIDTDEYLCGETRKYYRYSALDGYLTSQHHFTVEPRGAPAEVDKPARLIRTDRGYKCKGHIHEHFEVPESGPGRCMLIPDIDIGHTGYKTEAIRRARFFRNFPFLQWEHDEGGDRKLHRCLWIRDLCHRFRFTEDPQEKRKFALEGIQYFKDNSKDMMSFGPGLTMTLAYLSEFNAFLGLGTEMKISIQMDDRSLNLQGRFEDYEQMEGTISQILKPEFADRASRYY